MGPGGAVTLNDLAIENMFNYMAVDMTERLELLMKVKAIAAGSISAHHAEAEKKRKQAEAKSRSGRR